MKADVASFFFFLQINFGENLNTSVLNNNKSVAG